jgi:hypothetical protein
MHATDADEMAPHQRLDEIADILADGFLRLRRRPGHVPGAEHGGPQPAENTLPPSPELAGCPAPPSA